MTHKKHGFEVILKKSESIIKDLGLNIIYTHNLDPFFKGDLDGKTIFIGNHLSPSEKLFNLLHLAGHSIQWNTDELLRTMGSELYINPSDELLRKLQVYEWQANCYALSILHQASGHKLDKWLTRKYVADMTYLTHFYKTGKKTKHISARVIKDYPFKKLLEEKLIPQFIPKSSERTRNGIVVAF
jgi:hypothetical protein